MLVAAKPMRAQGNNRSRQYKRRNTKRVCGEEVGNDPAGAPGGFGELPGLPLAEGEKGSLGQREEETRAGKKHDRGYRQSHWVQGAKMAAKGKEPIPKGQASKKNQTSALPNATRRSAGFKPALDLRII